MQGATTVKKIRVKRDFPNYLKAKISQFGSAKNCYFMHAIQLKYCFTSDKTSIVSFTGVNQGNTICSILVLIRSKRHLPSIALKMQKMTFQRHNHVKASAGGVPSYIIVLCLVQLMRYIQDRNYSYSK